MHQGLCRCDFKGFALGKDGGLEIEWQCVCSYSSCATLLSFSLDNSVQCSPNGEKTEDCERRLVRED